MKKSVKNSKKLSEKQQRITILFGYVLFTFVVITSIASIVRLEDDFATLHPVMWSYFIGAGVAFAASSIFAPLAAYLLGDEATRSKSRVVHHYNGVLFGVLAFWLSLTIMLNFGLISAYSFVFVDVPGYIINSVLPAVITVVALVVCAITYAKRTKHQVSVIGYTPYRVLLFCSVGLVFLASGLAIAFGSWNGASFASSIAALLLPALFIGVLVLLGAWLIGKGNGSWGERFAKSLVAIGFAAVFISFGTQLFALDTNAVLIWLPLAAGLIWILYIYLLRKYPASIK